MSNVEGSHRRKKGAVNITRTDADHQTEEKIEMLESFRTSKSVSFSESEPSRGRGRLKPILQHQKKSIEDDPEAIESAEAYEAKLSQKVSGKRQDTYSDESSDNLEDDQSDDASEISSESGDAEADGDDNDDEDGVASLKRNSPKKFPSVVASQRSSSNSSQGRPSFTRQQSSRYEGRLREEDNSAQSAFEKRQEKRKQSQMLTALVTGIEQPESEGPTAEETFDFFTKIWPADESGSTRVSPLKGVSLHADAGDDQRHEEGGEEVDESVETDDHKKLFSKSIIGDKFDWQMTDLVGPEIPDRALVTRICCPDPDSVYVVPSDNHLDIEEKLGAGEQPRFPEEEGMYIGMRPNVTSKLQNKLEHRILLEQSTAKHKTRWFGQDGRLVALPDPILKRPTRPPIFEDLENLSEPETYFCSALLNGQSTDDDLAYGKFSGLSHCQLDVDIASIVFEHHHLFSQEHYLSVAMTEEFARYQKLRVAQGTKDLDQRLAVLYSAVDTLQEKKDTWTSDEKEFQLRRLETYTREIASMRTERDSDSKQERNLVKNILAFWKELREIRHKQGYSNTTTKIIIRKESCNLTADRLAWEKETKRQLDEDRDKYQEYKEKATKQYEEDLKAWKDMHNQRREARRRQKLRQKNADRGSGSADATEMALDEQLLANPEDEKPEPPPDFNEDEVKQRIEDDARQCRRLPGEPQIHLEFSSKVNELDGDNNTVQDNREQSRRQAVSKTRLFVRIFFNGREVCQSITRTLTPNFVVQLGQIFPIQIVQLPENLTVQIIEGSTLRTTTLAEISLPLCDQAIGLDKLSLTPVAFSSNIKLKHDHAGVGSGVDFPANLDGSTIRNESIRGKIYVRVGWGKSPEGEILAPPQEQWKRVSQDHSDPLREVMSSDGRIDPIKLEAWISKSRIDPNDPDNEELMIRVSEARRKTEAAGIPSGGSSGGSSVRPGVGGSYFRLEQQQDQLVFGSDADLSNNVRFQMIQLRMNKVDEFKNFRMIPITEKEIPRGILEAREKRAAASRREVVGSGDPLRGRSRLFLEQLRAQVSHRFSLARHRRRHSDVVVEDPIPDFGTLVMLFGEMVPAPRPLRPIRLERKKVSIQDLTGQEIKILLSVVRAYDVPVRSDLDPLANHNDGPKEALVHSYIEARFQGGSARTTIAEGPNPAWNQQLTLTFKSSNNDFSPDTLNRVKDCIYLHLFDEVTVDLIDDDREDRGTLVHQRLDRKWLGSLTIPFSSLYRNTRIEGTFRLHSPAVLLGYERTGGALSTGIGITGPGLLGGNGGSSSSGGDYPKNATYVNLYLTVQPALSVPEPVREKLDCDESEEVIQHCARWKRDLALKYPHRKVNPLVADVSGKSVLMTRFFKGLQPPKELVDLADSHLTAENVAWFVSLIPYTPTNALFPGLQDIWPTCDQFLQMMTGSEYEHALLLTNYFASLGKKSFLVLGQAVPEGDTAYVLTIEENGEHWLWNPVTSEHLKTTETFCPLESVYAIANESNIWGNLQPSDRPGRLRWDLSVGSDWYPLFGRQMNNPGSTSVQPNQIRYTTPDPRNAKHLKERLERVLRDTLMSLRKKQNQRTTMNFQGNAVLRKLLPGLEGARGGVNEKSNQGGITTISGTQGSTTGQGGTGSSLISDHLSELQRLTTSHKVCGFPLHAAFTDVESLTEAVTSTGVHLNREPGVEFALAVHVEPYPNTVMSVWVYVASMVRRR